MSEPASPTSRLFIAAWPALLAEDELDAAMRPLQTLRDLRLLRREKRHFTLRFLGQVMDSQREPISRACAETAAESAAFELTLSGAGAFPRASRATVLWIGVTQGASELAGLSLRLNERLAPLGYEPESRPFVPHLTVARSRRPMPLTAAAEALGALRLMGSVRSIALVRSRLGGAESTYETLKEFELGQGA